MEFLYYLTGYALIGVVIAGIVGLIKPSIFHKLLKKHATRAKIFFITAVVFFLLSSLLTATEPESAKHHSHEQNATQQPLDEQKSKLEESEPQTEEKTINETESIDFAVETKDDPSLPRGQTQVIQHGELGTKTLTYKVTYLDGEEIDRELTTEEVTTQPVTKIIANGTYEPAPAPQPVSAPSDVYYKNCSAARAAGAAPVYRGEPGYASHLDRNNDGVGCE